MKRLALAAVVVALWTGFASAGDNKYTFQFDITDSVGTSAWDVDSAGSNTGTAIDCRKWSSFVAQMRFTSGGDDSVDVVVHFEQSIDQTNWYVIDSTSLISDSSYYEHEVNADSLEAMPYLRAVLYGRAGTAASGVTGSILGWAEGPKE